MARILVFILLGSLPIGIGAAALVNNMGLPKWSYYACLVLIGAAGLIICQVFTMTFIKRRAPALATNEKLVGKKPAWRATAGMGIVPQWVSLIGLMPFSSGVALLYPVIASITGIALLGFPLAASESEVSEASVIFGWILWGVTSLWTAISLVSFIASILDKKGSYQPLLGIDYPIELRRLIGGVYTVCMMVALLFFIFTPYSKLHLLWFVPLFHAFGTGWLVPLYKSHFPSPVVELNEDDTQEVVLLLQQAEQGDADAQCKIGWRYAHGKGVPEDIVRAYVWLSLAVAKGDQCADAMRDICSQEMSLSQLSLAKDLAHKYMEFYEAKAKYMRAKAVCTKLMINLTLMQATYESAKTGYEDMKARYEPIKTEYEQIRERYERAKTCYERMDENRAPADAEYNKIRTEYYELLRGYKFTKSGYEGTRNKYERRKIIYDQVRAEYEPTNAEYEKALSCSEQLKSRYEQARACVERVEVKIFN
jgi:hypothetical protein